MPSPPVTTVVVVTWLGADRITACLDAVAAQDRPHRTIVVDNASTDQTGEILRAHPLAPTVLTMPKNTGYAGGIAAAMREVSTPFVAWLNDDATPEPGWLGALEDALEAHPGAAGASSKLVRPDGTVQSIGVGLTTDGHGFDLNGVIPSEVFGFCGGAALLRTDVLRAVGGVPAEFFCYYEDTDTSWRLRLAGWVVVSVPSARARHQHGASTRLGSDQFHRWNERNRLLMLLRCAPATVAAAQLARFVLTTKLLWLRRLLRRPVPDAPNFRVGLRLRVLADVAGRLPAALRARRRCAVTVSRREIWRQWAGA